MKCLLVLLLGGLLGCSTFKKKMEDVGDAVNKTAAKSVYYAATKLNSFNNKSASPSKSIYGHVVGGKEVSLEDSWRTKAVLLQIKRSSKTSTCTAAVLGESLLITAAHCVSDAAPQDVTARVEFTGRNKAKARQDKVLKAQKIITHPQYDKTPQSHSDLALIKLAGEIPSEYPLVSLYDGKSALNNDEVIFLGYGITGEEKADSQVLRTTTKSYKKDAFIKGALLGFNQTTKGGGYCRGDSGAPVYVTSGGSLKVISINSFNVGTEKNRECHTASFGMYIPHFREWILTQVLEL